MPTPHRRPRTPALGRLPARRLQTGAAQAAGHTRTTPRRRENAESESGAVGRPETLRVQAVPRRGRPLWFPDHRTHPGHAPLPPTHHCPHRARSSQRGSCAAVRTHQATGGQCARGLVGSAPSKPQHSSAGNPTGPTESRDVSSEPEGPCFRSTEPDEPPDTGQHGQRGDG